MYPQSMVRIGLQTNSKRPRAVVSAKTMAEVAVDFGNTNMPFKTDVLLFMKMYNVSRAEAENQVAIERGAGQQVQVVNGQAIEMI